MKTLGYFDNIFSFIQSNTDYVEESKYAWGELGKVCGWLEKAGYFLPSEFTYVLCFLDRNVTINEMLLILRTTNFVGIVLSL